MVGNGATVRVMMKDCLKDKNPSEAERFFRIAKEKGVELGQVEFNFAVEAVCMKPDVNAACALLKEMTEKAWVPSRTNYVQAIISCLKEQNMVEALRLKDEMVSCRQPMKLSVATSLMKGYCVAGDVESALGVFERLPDLGLSLSEVNYSDLIQGFCAKGYMEKVYELFEQMIGKGYEPCGNDFSLLIKGLSKANLLEKAFEQFNKMVDAGWADVYSYNILMLQFVEMSK